MIFKVNLTRTLLRKRSKLDRIANSSLIQKVFFQARSRVRKSRETRILALQMFFMMIQRKFFDRSELVLTKDQRARITGPKLISNIANDPNKKRKSTTQL